MQRSALSAASIARGAQSGGPAGVTAAGDEHIKAIQQQHILLQQQAATEAALQQQQQQAALLRYIQNTVK